MSSRSLQLRVSAAHGFFKIQTVRHDEDEIEAVLQSTDRLHTRSKYADQFAAGEDLDLAAYRTASIIFPWLYGASTTADSHSAACVTSL